MGYAEFTDRDGKSWRVWHTLPRSAPVLTSLPQEWKEGWLTFECDGEKRRLAPIPLEWETFPASRLEVMCRMAKPVTRTPVTDALLPRDERHPE